MEELKLYAKCAWCGKRFEQVRKKARRRKFCCDECCKKSNTDKQRTQHQQARNKVLMSLGGHCYKCGIEDIRCLEIHHIDPSKKTTKGNQKYSMKARVDDWNANKGNLRVLCANCHKIHHAGNGRLW